MSMLYHDYQVIVAGQDVTSRFDPLLKSISITRASGSAADECSLSIADADGNIYLPSKRDTVLINIDGQQAFLGWVSDLDYKIDKGSGREMSISASSIDQGSKVKEPVLRHKDGGTLSAVASEWGAKIGIQVSVSGSISSVERDYWFSQNESFMSWGQRMANEVGASFKIIGNRAFLVGINEGLSSSGAVLAPIKGEYGVNLISASIAPIISKPKFKNVKLSYFDVKKGETVEVDVPSGIADVDADLRSVIKAANAGQAKQKAAAKGKVSDREKGSGSARILGDVFAEPEAMFTLSGVRPGIDGSYRIGSVEHSISKGSGFHTEINLKQPQDGAGIDSRT